MLDEIKEMLDQCKLPQLYEVENYLEELLRNCEAATSAPSDEEGRRQRREQRIQSSIRGKLTRLTDIRPGDTETFTAIIRDISRHGMRIEVNRDYIPSRIIRVTFAVPSGDVKRCHLEVVRMGQRLPEEGGAFELGCRSISDQAVRKALDHEDKLTEARGKLGKKGKLRVIVVGLYQGENLGMVARIKADGYPVTHVYDLARTLHSNTLKLGPKAAVFCPEVSLCEHLDQLKQIQTQCPQLACLAVIKDQQECKNLFEAHIDECVLEKDLNHLLLASIERAILNRHMLVEQRHGGPAQVLIISSNQVASSLIQLHLEKKRLRSRLVRNFAEAEQVEVADFDLILAEFQPGDRDKFIQIGELFYGVPVVALCHELSHGHAAMVNGAANYLVMPVRIEDMDLILNSLLSKKQQVVT